MSFTFEMNSSYKVFPHEKRSISVHSSGFDISMTTFLQDGISVLLVHVGVGDGILSS